MTLKEQLFLQCQDFIVKRKNVVEKAILEIETALQSETKSSAGDKHETGRAMLQLEREKSGNQLAQIQKIITTLSKIDISKINSNISFGSLVYTTQANYFITISTGEIIIDNQKFYAISPSTPIGQLLMGKTSGDMIIFREEKYKILKVL